MSAAELEEAVNLLEGNLLEICKSNTIYASEMEAVTAAARNLAAARKAMRE